MRPIDVTFEDVERLVYMLIHEMRRYYFLDYEDTKSAAFYGFMQAYISYTPDKGEFTSWVSLKVNKRILDLLRERMKESERPFDRDFNLEKAICPECGFNLDHWLESLSREARRTALLVIQPPADVRATLAQLGNKAPTNWRYAIREFLKEIGWTERRISRVFREIRESL